MVVKIKDTPKFLTENEAQELFLNLQNDASVATSEDFIQVDISDDTYTNLLLDSPFFDFLKTKGRVLPTDSAVGAFRNVVVPEEARSKFSDNETASDVTNTSVEFTAPKYSCAVVARRISATDMFQDGNPGYDPMQVLREQATLDNYTAIDEGLFNKKIDKKFDGIGETTQNLINAEAAPVTMEILQRAVRQVMNNGGRVDGVIATGGAVEQLITSDDPDNKKVYPNSADVILGKWSTQVMTASGLVPLIVDPNINNRFLGAPDALSDAIFVIDSRAVEANILQDSISRVLGASDFSDKELIGTFLRMGNLQPGRNAKVYNIASLDTAQSILFTLTNSVSHAAIAGAVITLTQTISGNAITKTATTDANGRASIDVNSEIAYSVSIAKTGYTTYTHSYTAGGDDAFAVELVPST
ncbi:MAG: carboxypeptidase-like regulatory domain-containing protein [Methanobacterium sp. ERen5]|nr:MAG: carboxypeptidase-like regulatory domain-containing protein [Methanobacterium sp. ERen5]